jgi:Fe-S oxidoreductase
MLLNYPELSGDVLGHKLDSIQATGVDTLITNCTACILQLRGGLDKRKSDIKVMHTAELLAKSRKENTR